MSVIVVSVYCMCSCLPKLVYVIIHLFKIVVLHTLPWPGGVVRGDIFCLCTRYTRLDTSLEDNSLVFVLLATSSIP